MDGLETFVAFQVATSCRLLTFITYTGMAEGEKIKMINKDYSLLFFEKKLSPSANCHPSLSYEC